MSTIRHPVGPQSPSVYWRRRLVVIAIVLAVVVVVLLIVFRPTAGAPNPAESGTPGGDTAQTPDPGATTSTGALAECSPSQVRVAPIVDSTTFANGVEPMLSMEITNVGAAPCTFDVGTAAQEYVITSGTDRIWSSRDCQTEPAESVITLNPDEKLATTPFAWDRTRSSPGCSGSQPEVIAGGASYHLSVKLGEAESEDTFQFILS